MLLMCVSLKLSKDTAPEHLCHGVGAGSRVSTTVYGHVSAETLNDDLTPESFNKNIWSLSHIKRISLSHSHVYRNMEWSPNEFSMPCFAFIIEPNLFQRKA